MKTFGFYDENLLFLWQKLLVFAIETNLNEPL